MINELTIKGLKCFEEAEFHFKNLTLLAGIASNDTEGKESFSRRIYRYRKNQ